MSRTAERPTCLSARLKRMADGEEPAPSAPLPRAGAFADVYDQLIKLAARKLDRPISTRIRTWEDETFEIRVWHKYGVADGEGHLKGVVRYHSGEEKLSEALLEVIDGKKRLLFERELSADRVVADDATDTEWPSRA